MRKEAKYPSGPVTAQQQRVLERNQEHVVVQNRLCVVA